MEDEDKKKMEGYHLPFDKYFKSDPTTLHDFPDCLLVLYFRIHNI